MAHTYSRPTMRPNTHSLPPRRSVTHNTPQIGPEPDPPKAQSRGLATISSSPEIRLGCSPAASHCRVTRGERPRRVSRLEQRLKLAIEACAHHSERTATRRQPVKPWVGSSASPFSMRNKQHSTPMVRLGQLGQRVAARAIVQIAALRRARAYPVRSAPLRGRNSERALLVERRRLAWRPAPPWSSPSSRPQSSSPQRRQRPRRWLARAWLRCEGGFAVKARPLASERVGIPPRCSRPALSFSFYNNDSSLIYKDALILSLLSFLFCDRSVLYHL